MSEEKKEIHKLKCKIVREGNIGMFYIVVDQNYKIVSNGISSDEGWVIHDAGGYHTKEKFDELYGDGCWEVDFSDMYSDENSKISGKIEPNIVIEFSDSKEQKNDK